jgi:hypothetical protein
MDAFHIAAQFVVYPRVPISQKYGEIKARFNHVFDFGAAD